MCEGNPVLEKSRSNAVLRIATVAVKHRLCGPLRSGATRLREMLLAHLR